MRDVMADSSYPGGRNMTRSSSGESLIFISLDRNCQTVSSDPYFGEKLWEIEHYLAQSMAGHRNYKKVHVEESV
ncbi:hypothetical protein J6590_085662 [Homalodisca vitripennis]|nr:hypothetical protein J6590_085662 [Homalodisca vitripennis]